MVFPILFLHNCYNHGESGLSSEPTNAYELLDKTVVQLKQCRLFWQGSEDTLNRWCCGSCAISWFLHKLYFYFIACILMQWMDYSWFSTSFILIQKMVFRQNLFCCKLVSVKKWHVGSCNCSYLNCHHHFNSNTFAS